MRNAIGQSIKQDAISQANCSTDCPKADNALQITMHVYDNERCARLLLYGVKTQQYDTVAADGSRKLALEGAKIFLTP